VPCGWGWMAWSNPSLQDPLGPTSDALAPAATGVPSRRPSPPFGQHPIPEEAIAGV